VRVTAEPRNYPIHQICAGASSLSSRRVFALAHKRSWMRACVCFRAETSIEVDMCNAGGTISRKTVIGRLSIDVRKLYDETNREYVLLPSGPLEHLLSHARVHCLCKLLTQ
jgi:hypothetical protein